MIERSRHSARDCDGSAARVSLTPADAARKATACGTCGRELSVRVGRKDGRVEATIPRHRAKAETLQRQEAAHDAHAWGIPTGLPEMGFSGLGL